MRIARQILADKESASADLIAAADAEVEAHREEVANSHREVQITESALQQVTARKEAAESEQAAAEAKEAQLVKDADALKARAAEAKAARSNMSSQSVRDKVLLAAKQDGSIPGFIGKLGSLGSIPKKYDVAISTACGALDNLVVKDTKSAEAVLEMARKKNLGVVTCIILDRLQGLVPRMGPINVPSGAQRLFDLVECPVEEHRVAFYKGLNDTLVCEDKTLASKIALDGAKRHRVVTTDGVVFNTSGTMEGGGKPLSGRMGGGHSGDVLSEVEVKQLFEQAEEATTKLEELRSARAAAQVNVRNMQKEVSKLATQLKKLQMVVEAADKQAAALEQAAQRARSGGAALSPAEKAQAADLDKKLATMGKRTAAQQAKVDAVDAEIAELQEQVLAVGGVMLRAQKSKVETLKGQSSGIQQQLTKARVQLEAAEKVAAKLEAAEARQRQAAADQESKNAAVKARLEELTDEAAKVAERQSECDAEVIEKAEAMKAIEKQYEECKSVVSKVRSIEVEMNAQLEDYARSIKENKGRAKHWEGELQKLREMRIASAEANADLEAGDEGEGGSMGESEEALADLSDDVLATLDVAELQVKRLCP